MFLLHRSLSIFELSSIRQALENSESNALYQLVEDTGSTEKELSKITCDWSR